MLIALDTSRTSVLTKSACALVESWLYAQAQALDLGRDEPARVKYAAASRGHGRGPDRHAAARDPAPRDTVCRNT